MEQMPRLLDRTLVFQGYLKVERLRLEYPGAKVAVREVESHGDSVAILPFDPERRMALTVRQFRAPAFYWLEEACAGMIDGAETAEAAAFRELQEELGLEARGLQFCGATWPSPGVCAERAHLFLAEFDGNDRTGAGGGLDSEHEHITVLERPLTELADDADAGRIVDLCLLALIQTLRVRRPELFRQP